MRSTRAAWAIGLIVLAAGCEPKQEKASRAHAPAPAGARETPTAPSATTDATPTAPVAKPAATDAEKIEWLIVNLEKSDAIFIRNNSEHTGEEAAGHLRTKLSYAGGAST